MAGNEVSRPIHVLFNGDISLNGLKRSTAISKAASYGIMSLVSVLFQ